MRLSSAVTLLVLTLPLAACATSSGATGGQEVEAGNPRQAAKRAREVVAEVYGALRRGDRDSLQGLVAPAPFIVGPGAAQVYTDRTEALVALAEGFKAGKRHKLSSRGLVVVPSPGGRAAWVADQIELDGTALRVTAVLVDVDELWMVAALQLSRPVPDARAAELRDAGKLPAPAALPGGVDDGAGGADELFRAGAKEPARFVDQLSPRKEALFYGPGPKAAVRGGKAIKKAWKKAYAAEAAPAMDVGAVRAGITPDGGLAWVSASLEVDAIPQRFFYVYEKKSGEGDEGDEGGAWRLVAAHHGVAVE